LNTYNNKIERKRKISISAVHAVLIIISLCCVIPMFLIISASLTEEMAIIKNGYSFLPSKFMTDAYEVILKNPQQILRGYAVTVTVSITGTFFGLLLTSSLAYVMSRKDYAYKNKTSLFILIPRYEGHHICTYCSVSCNSLVCFTF